MGFSTETSVGKTGFLGTMKSSPRLGDLIEDDLEAMEDMEMVERYVKIGIWCIQEEPGMRPSMRSLTQMLEGVAQVHDPPNPSPYSIFSCEEYLSCGQVSRV
ncbi:hypothetical protein YC2023_020530 [Brassica napus]